jgi:hypothetical protein
MPPNNQIFLSLLEARIQKAAAAKSSQTEQTEIKEKNKPI